MEDIYDDLNNYEDVNCVQELRNENMELKVKLEEYAAAMEKLQKDYDKLEMEFKRLENNYSSLLKTARSEIERKTQRITQLNKDKDMMVLESLKYGKNIRRNFNKSVQSQVQANKKGEESNKMKHHTSGVQTENYPSSGTDCRISMVNKFDSTSAKLDSSYKTKSIVRENPAHHKTEYNNTPKTFASNIKDRRKSVPVGSMAVETFSSDEENERIFRAKETRTDSSIQDKFERSNINKFLIEYSNKTSETSSIDDRASNNHEPTSREIYRGRTSRHDNNLNRCRDTYKGSLKYRKDYSPERGQKRQHSHNEYQDDCYRQEKGRHRSRDNPPPEHDRYQRRKSDHRANYDRHSYDHEKYRHNYEDKYGAKQKMSNEYDEPFSKRQKIENVRNPDAHNRVEKEFNNDRESIDIQSISKLSPNQYDVLRLSCQSPDNVYTDAALAYPIKEIMATATTPLEDPRMTSKRYTITKDNAKEKLSAVVGRNIDIKPINKTLWNIERVTIPDALVRRPSQVSYEVVKDIDISIDSPEANLSLESGEIHFESDNESHETSDQSKVISHIINNNISRQVTKELSKQLINAEDMSKPNVAKYRIPKIGQSNRSTQSKKDVPIIDVSERKPTILSKKVTVEDDFTKKILTMEKNEDHRNLHSSNKNDSKHENMETKNQVTLSKMAIVADDLELSDENSDNVDCHRQTITEKVKKYCKVQPNIRDKENFTCDPKKHSDNIIANTDEAKGPVDTGETKAVEADEKAKTKESSFDSSKKQKSKKKKPKSKEVSKDSTEGTNTITVTEKKKRSKKEKECKPKEANTKFSDLFGDSSSLMTPEDLGIPSYLPISEDAQDAVDLKINQIIDASPITDKAECSGGNKAQSSTEINEQELKQQDNKAEIELPKSNTDSKEETKDIQKKMASKRKEEIDTDEISPSDIYENLNPGADSNDPDIVKTVIISTGVQPQITFGNNSEPVLGKPNKDMEVHTEPSVTDCFSIPAIMDLKRQDILKALATSTPQKETILNSVTDNRTHDATVSDSSSSKTLDSGPVQAVNQTNMNVPDSEDAPDVRIFVKRRRKITKRPPMT